MTDLSRPTLPGALPGQTPGGGFVFPRCGQLRQRGGLAAGGRFEPAGAVAGRHAARALAGPLGSGTGHFSRKLGRAFRPGQRVAVDIAEGMLRHARQEQGGARHHVAGDAERLPLRDASVDLVFQPGRAVVRDFRRVLSEAFGRVCALAACWPSAACAWAPWNELRASWQAVDGLVHVNRFRRFRGLPAPVCRQGL